MFNFVKWAFTPIIQITPVPVRVLAGTLFASSTIPAVSNTVSAIYGGSRAVISTSRRITGGTFRFFFNRRNQPSLPVGPTSYPIAEYLDFAPRYFGNFGSIVKIGVSVITGAIVVYKVFNGIRNGKVSFTPNDLGVTISNAIKDNYASIAQILFFSGFASAGAFALVYCTFNFVFNQRQIRKEMSLQKAISEHSTINELKQNKKNQNNKGNLGS